MLELKSSPIEITQIDESGKSNQTPDESSVNPESEGMFGLPDKLYKSLSSVPEKSSRKQVSGKRAILSNDQ